jgi:anti-sigma factor RsiW
MSHVDDGMLHAYLDGELSPVERERMDQHLAACDACRARLDEERELVARAGRLLGLAAPPDRAAPPLHELRRPRRGGGLRLPLAWAATVTLAIGLGWFARGTMRSSDRQHEVALDSGAATAPAVTSSARPRVRGQIATTPAPSATAPALTPAPMGRAEPRRDQPSAAGASDVSDALARRQESDQRLRAAPAAPVAKAAVPAEAVAANALADEERAGAPAGWTTIEPQHAHDLLGSDPAVIPGYPTRALRSNPANPKVILVEQVIGGMVVQLFEQRNDVEGQGAGRSANAAPARGYAANERLARYVGPLRIEIAGAVPADSLSILLGLVR